MVAKFIVVLCLAVAATAVPLVPVAKVAYAEPEAPAHYEFQYSVHDEQTGDIKQQQEARAGDDVHGSYSLVQPDGVHRIVEYTSSKEQGFNAVVRYEGHPIAAPAPAKVAYAAPVAKLAYATAPVAKVAYASPVSYHAAPVSYHSTPVSYHATPVSYHATPVARVAYSSPISYASPVAKVAYAAPVQKYATYASPLTQVTFSSPTISYHH